MERAKESRFGKLIMQWNAEKNRRSMPWKGEKDPYRIWLSEIILQQTRVEQGLSYYNRFIQQYPTIQHLASADDAAVFKCWEGLGYYSRCRNLIATARQIVQELDAVFPTTYESILSLKGIGPYTAAAIASFAYNLPYAVVDGNVIRVLARYFGIRQSAGSSAGKKFYTALANRLLTGNDPATFNQAIMDFGATVCKPQLPVCSGCCLQKHCTAFKDNLTDGLPVKENKPTKKQRWFYYLIIEFNGAYYIRKRTQKDIWQNLHEFYLEEKSRQTDPEELVAGIMQKLKAAKGSKVTSVSKMYRQQLTHQAIHGCFIHISIKKKINIPGFELYEKSAISKLAFPRFITGYFDEIPFTQGDNL